MTQLSKYHQSQTTIHNRHRCFHNGIGGALKQEDIIDI